MYAPEEYACLFPALIKAWRAQFAASCPLCPFIFVELAPIVESAGMGNFSATRVAQHAALALPNVAFACTLDLGDPESPSGRWHPRLKQEIGDRLALAAWKLMYATGKDVVASGPVLASATGTFTAESLVINVTYAETGGRLQLKPSNNCTLCCPLAGAAPTRILAEVSLDSGSGSGSSWLPTTFVNITADSVFLSARAVRPAAVASLRLRFFWADYPECVVVNDVGLPASPAVVDGAIDAIAAAVDATSPAHPRLRLPTVVSSHMVLQRQPARAQLWGWVDNMQPGLTVRVTLSEEATGALLQTKTASPSGDANAWSVLLDPLPASTGYSVRFELASHESVVHDTLITDIAFGDVHLCVGQSNMQMGLEYVMNGTLEVDGTMRFPDVRVFTVEMVVSGSELLDLQSAAFPVQWARASPGAVSGPSLLSYFSSTCFLFGSHLQQLLAARRHGDVPMGLISSSWGGSWIERYIPGDVVPRCSAAAKDAQPEGASPVQWNAMLAPLIPMRFASVVWCVVLVFQLCLALRACGVAHS